MIEQEIAFFKRMQAEFSRRYGDQYVAIYQEKVVTHGPDRAALVEQVYVRFGTVPCFIERANTTEPRTARMPSVRVVRRIDK